MRGACPAADRRHPYGHFAAIPVLVLLLWAAPAGASTANLRFEQDWIDLDSGTIEADCDYQPCSGDQDFHFAYAGGQANPVRLFHNELGGRQVAFLDGRPFAAVTRADAAGADWSSNIVDEPLDPDDTILVRTELGRVFKVGEAAIEGNDVAFCYEELYCTTSLSFGQQWFDLDSGVVEADCDPGPCSGQQDFQFAHDGTRPNPVVLVQLQQAGRQVAFLDGQPFSTVTRADATWADWTSEIIDQPFDPDDTILFRTELGNVFKVGEAIIGANAVAFCYEELPCDSGSSLVFEQDWFDLDSGTIEVDCEFQPCSGVQDFKFAYAAGQANPVRLFHNELGGRQVALLDGQHFATITRAHVDSASWTSSLVDQPLDPDDTFLLRTDQGRIFKVGQASVEGNSVAFCYERLACGSSSSLAHGRDWFDLDGEVVESSCEFVPCSGQQDFRFAYDSAQANPISLHQLQADGREVAFLDGQHFATVTQSDLADANWTSGLVQQPFDPDDTMLVRTDQGELFKVGEAAIEGGTVAFCYESLWDPGATTNPPLPHFDLAQNRPNPFNPSTRIRFRLTVPGAVRLVVYGSRGQRVRVLADRRYPAGEQWLTWDGTDERGRPVATGSYHYELRAGGQSQVRKMVLVR